VKITLLAYSEFDGSAIIKLDGRLELVRPPFKSGNIASLDEKDLRYAILHLGFLSSALEYDSWVALIEFLNDKVREAGKIRGDDLSDVDVLRTLIDVAPHEALERYLDRVRDEFIPSRKLDHAESVLLTMIESDAVRESKTLTQKITQLLRSVMEARHASLVRKYRHEDSLFESLQRKGRLDEAHAMGDRIRRTQSVFAFAD